MNRPVALLLALVSLLLPGFGHALAGVRKRALLPAELGLAGQLGSLAVQPVARVTLALRLVALARAPPPDG